LQVISSLHDSRVLAHNPPRLGTVELLLTRRVISKIILKKNVFFKEERRDSILSFREQAGRP
jgi:hypothetical protein